VATTPYVTVGNIIAGPCSSFTVDATAVGGTSGGVMMERKMTYTDLEVDQIVGVLKQALSKDAVTVTTTLSEATLANLQIAFNVTAAPVVSPTPATMTLSLGVETAPVEHILVFIGPCPAGAASYTKRTVTLHRAINMSAAKMDFIKDKEQGYQVQFTILPDLTQTEGSEYGTFVDSVV